MAQTPRPKKFDLNYENLDPNKNRFTDGRISTENVISTNHGFTYGKEGIPRYFYLTIELNGGLYNGVAPAEGKITIEGIPEGADIQSIFAEVSGDITKGDYSIQNIFYDSGFTSEVHAGDKLTGSISVYIKWTLQEGA